MKNKVNHKSWIAFLLAIILVSGTFPINVVALESNDFVDTEVANDVPEIVADSQEYTDNELIGEVVEIVSLREKNVKHFHLADGTYEAVVYAHPVHRKDENGVWQDIDNNLSLTDDGILQKYRTSDSRVKFAD